MPIPLILSFLKGNWKIILGSLLFLGALMYVQGLRLDNSRLETRVETLTNDNRILKGNNEKLEGAIDVSNKALERANAAADKAKLEFEALNGTLVKRTNDLKKQLADILNQKEPTTCNDSIVFLISNAKGYAK